MMMPKFVPGLTRRSVTGVSAGVVGKGGTVSVVVSGEVYGGDSAVFAGEGVMD